MYKKFDARCYGVSFLFVLFRLDMGQLFRYFYMYKENEGK